jgi:hypothetical protein
MKDGSGRADNGGELDLVLVERRAAASWARGRTRRVRVTYGCHCGTLAGAEAVAVLNVQEHPEQAEELLSGALNRSACPACGADHLLRVPVIVHDPVGRRVVLCAGEGDRHRALDLLIHYLEGLRDQPGDSVPGYALQPEIAFGRAAWREHLGAPPRAALHAEQSAVQQRQRELEDRGRALDQRQATLAAGQRDIETARAAIESQLRIVGDRSAGLEAREAELVRREGALAEQRHRLEEVERRLRQEQQQSQLAREEVETLRSAIEDREAVLRRREEDLTQAEDQLDRRATSIPLAATSPAAPPAAPPAAAPAVARSAPAAVEPIALTQPVAKAPAPAAAAPAAAASSVPVAASPAPSVPVASSLSELPSLLMSDDDEAMAVGDADVVDERLIEPDTEVSRRSAREVAEARVAEAAVRTAAKAAAAPTPVAPAAAPAPVAAAPAAVEEPVLEVRDSDLLPDAGVVEVDASDLGEVEEEPGPAAVSGATVPRLASAAATRVPEHLVEWLSGELPTFALRMDDGVRLYRRRGVGQPLAGRAGLGLVCRLWVHEEVPWLETAAVVEGESGPEWVESWLVHFELVGDAAVVRALGERFQARLIEVDERGRIQWDALLEAPLARNAVRIRQAAGRLDARRKGDRGAALAAARSEAGTWLERGSLPAFAAPEPTTPGETQRALVELTPWMTEEAEERLLVQHAVPADEVDRYRRRTLSAAVQAGLWLPPDLVQRAVQDGLAPTPARLTALLVEGFYRLCGGRHDLSREAVARNWLYLSRDADQHGLLLEEPRRAWIRALLRAAGLGEGAGGAPVVGPESAQGEMELLLRWLAVAEGRTAALRELQRGRLAEFVPELAVALDVLDPFELLDALLELRGNEDLLADLLMAGLEARGRPLRLASASGLGRLGLRRAIVPLVHLLQRSDSADWRFVGAAISSYGATGVKALEPMLADPRGKEDRLAWTLAGFQGAAAKRHVQGLTESGEILTAAIARRSAELRADVDAFRARLEQDDGISDAHAFVRLVPRVLGEEDPAVVREALSGLRSQGGMDI